MANQRTRGKKYEQVAAAFLKRAGYEIVGANVRVDHKEIDMICRDRQELVFVEVKGARASEYGDAVYKVDRRKQRSLINAAVGYLQRYPTVDYSGYRFDVIVIRDSGGKLEAEHLKAAFTA